ncbi:MAG: nuclear transport factor 2 family protein [Ilumatobacteraceae bacterium]
MSCNKTGPPWGQKPDREAPLGRIFLPRFDATQHLIGNISVDFTGPDDATAVSYLRAFHRYTTDRPDLVLWGEYHDRWVRAADGWRIAERRVLTAGIDGTPDPGRRNPRHRPHADESSAR